MTDSKSDLLINGYGSFSGGEYQVVRINGLGKVKGDIHCVQFTTNGDSLIEGNVQSESLRVTGSSTVEGKLKTRETKVNGQLTTEAQMDTKDISINGSAVIKGKLSADQADIRGAITVEEDLEAEAVSIKGVFNIKGLLNAGKVHIELLGNAKAKEIGGEKIVVKKSGIALNKLLKSFFADKSLSVDVIEGDEIELEYTRAKIVRGKNVKIGPGCKVDLVEYQDSYDADSEAEVKEEKQV
ncbi:polymer-forming cytoskeletal protein [Thermoactinomyces mirandus]|uniref:Polymer-forming cytoskeletal protein n=1 Tax=Thermoactinomyces mirandus TaxID=2756294 RepID=A0A7W2ATK2_9BACL|nr:polymer-forming cytoskeletal protein [Thermoactinomyces mirandus]MBA4603606.1 polymer-forming cytoskeletal protein [Thermoactinomyces mirandus]